MHIIDEKENENKMDKPTKNNTDQNIDDTIDFELLKKRGYNPHRLVDSVVEEDNMNRK
jgi:hypothetical protein